MRQPAKQLVDSSDKREVKYYDEHSLETSSLLRASDSMPRDARPPERQSGVLVRGRALRRGLQLGGERVAVDSRVSSEGPCAGRRGRRPGPPHRRHGHGPRPPSPRHV